MDTGSVIALAGLILTAVLAVGGGIVKRLLGKVDAAEAKVSVAEARAVTAENRANTAEALADSKTDTIQELHRQVQRMAISAEITDRLMTQLPPRTPDTGSYRPRARENE